MDGVCWHVTTPRLLQPCATGLATSWGHEGLRWATLMHTADLWMPSEKARSLFGNLTGTTVTLKPGGTVWVPALPDRHFLRGVKYTASGTLQQLQHLSAHIIQQCSAAGEALDGNSESKQWLYLNDEDKQFGPFSGQQLHKWNSSGIWDPSFSICHGPSGVWLPVWLVLQLLGLTGHPAPAAGVHGISGNAITATAADTGVAEVRLGATGGRRTAMDGSRSGGGHDFPDRDSRLSNYGRQPQHQQQQGRYAHHAVPRQADAAQQQAVYGPGTDNDGCEYGYHTQRLQHLSSSRTSASAVASCAARHRTSGDCLSKAAAAAGTAHYAAAAAGRTGHAAADDDFNDEDMADLQIEVLAELQRLRQNSEFLQELSRAVDMDWEPVHQHLHQQQQQEDVGLQQHGSTDISALELAQRGAQQHSVYSDIQSGSLLLLVIDTNVLLNSKGLYLLEQLQDVEQQQQLRVRIVIPWTVLVELDKLKGRSSSSSDGCSVSAQARAALRHLRSVMSPDSNCRHLYQAQNIQEFRAAARQFDFGVSDRLLVADDRILQCAMSHQHNINHQQQQQLALVQGAAAGQSGLLLLTDDTAFRIKAQANSVAVASLKELPVITADGSHYHQQQQILTALCRLAGLQTTCTVVDSNANSRISLPGTAVVAPPPAAAGRTVLLTCHQQEQNHQQQQQQDRTEESATSLALGHITNLRLGLSSRVIGIFKSEYDDLWLDVISSRPPWRDVDFLYVLQKHWRSTLQDHLQPATRSKRHQLEIAVQYLIDISKQLRNRRAGSSSRGAAGHHNVTQEQLQQNVAARVIQLLEAFGAVAAAQDVAAAAGLQVVGALQGAAADGHTVDSPGYHAVGATVAAPWGLASHAEHTPVPHSSTKNSSSVKAVDVTAAEMAAIPDSNSQYRQRVGESVQQQQYGQGLTVHERYHSASQLVVTPGLSQPSSGAVDLTNRPLAASAEALTSPGSGGSTKSRPRLHAVRHSQQQTSTAVNHIPTDHIPTEDYGSPRGGDRPSKQQCRVTVDAQESRQQQQQLVYPSPEPNRAQQAAQEQDQATQGQHGNHHHHHQQQQQQQHQNPNVMSSVSSACASVHVPQLQGPCLRLSQLAEYALALLTAVVPPLQQLQQKTPAAAANISQTIVQQLERVTQLLAYSTSVLAAQAQQPQQQGILDSSMHVLQDPVLQLGLQLVQLCCLLLSDAAAGVAVSGQITSNASLFVQDGLLFLLEQLQQQQPGSIAQTLSLFESATNLLRTLAL